MAQSLAGPTTTTSTSAEVAYQLLLMHLEKAENGDRQAREEVFAALEKSRRASA